MTLRQQCPDSGFMSASGEKIFGSDNHKMIEKGVTCASFYVLSLMKIWVIKTLHYIVHGTLPLWSVVLRQLYKFRVDRIQNILCYL